MEITKYVVLGIFQNISEGAYDVTLYGGRTYSLRSNTERFNVAEITWGVNNEKSFSMRIRTMSLDSHGQNRSTEFLQLSVANTESNIVSVYWKGLKNDISLEKTDLSLLSKGMYTMLLMKR